MDKYTFGLLLNLIHAAEHLSLDNNLCLLIEYNFSAPQIVLQVLTRPLR